MSFQAIFGLPEFSGMVIDLHLGNARTDGIGVNRNEAVHFPIQAKTGDHFPPVGLERAAVIMQFHAGHPRNEPIGHARGQGAREKVVLTVKAPAADHVIAFLIFATMEGISAGSFCRSASRSTITSPLAWSMPAAMAAVWPKFRRRTTALAFCGIVFDDLSDLFQAAVFAAVVNEDQLPGYDSAVLTDFSIAPKSSFRLCGFVIHRYDDGQLH